jgi:hypothetical protein
MVVSSASIKGTFMDADLSIAAVSFIPLEKTPPDRQETSFGG